MNEHQGSEPLFTRKKDALASQFTLDYILVGARGCWPRRSNTARVASAGFGAGERLATIPAEGTAGGPPVAAAAAYRLWSGRGAVPLNSAPVIGSQQISLQGSVGLVYRERGTLCSQNQRLKLLVPASTSPAYAPK